MKIVDGMKICLIIFTLCFLLVGTGCESKKNGVAKKDKDNPCSLLSKEDVEAVLKQKIEEPEADGIICIYQSVKRSPSAYLKLDLSPIEADMFIQNRNDFKNKDSFKSVEGVGENAYFFNGYLHILAKKHYLSMTIEGGQTSEEDVMGLAKKAVGKIK